MDRNTMIAWIVQFLVEMSDRELQMLLGFCRGLRNPVGKRGK